MPDKKKTLKDLIHENVKEDDFKEEILELDIDNIKPNPYQPRYVFDDDTIDDLASSIKEHGIIQPIIVKKMNGFYVVIAGERRLRAAKKADLKKIPAIVRQYEKSKMIELALIENLQREDLSPAEEAKGYMQIMRELDMNQTEVAKKVGKSRSYVTNMLGILNLPDEVLDLVDSKKISMGHARTLSKMLDKQKSIELAKKIIDEDLSVREIEKIVSKEEKKKPIKKTKTSKYINYEYKLNNIYNITSKVDKKKIVLNIKDQKTFEKIIKILIGE